MRSRAKKKGAPPLMLTSLLDMFTIILIFLIVSFEAESYEFRLNPDLTLPDSSARSVFRPAVNLAITPSGVFVEQEAVVALSEGKATDEAYALGYIPDLVDQLKVVYAERAAEVPEPTGEADEEEDGTIVVLQADKDLDYRTLYLVMRSASQAGFTRHRLAVMKR